MFMRIPNLRSSTDEIIYTSEQVFEIIKCTSDPIYFAEKFFNGKYNQEILRDIVNNDHLLTYSMRQSGKTSTYIVYMIWKFIFDQSTVVYTTDKLYHSDDVAVKFKELYLTLPMWLQSGISVWNHKTIKSDKSTFKIVSFDDHSFRGFNISLLVVDDVDMVSEHMVEELISCTLPVILCGKNNKILMSSSSKVCKAIKRIIDVDTMSCKFNINVDEVKNNTNVEYYEGLVSLVGLYSFIKKFNENNFNK